MNRFNRIIEVSFTSGRLYEMGKVTASLYNNLITDVPSH